jgi:PAS domain S-box-containing protein
MTQPLSELRGGAADLATSLALLSRIADAVGELHRGGAIHRELSSRTILRDPATGAVTIAPPSDASEDEWLASLPADAAAYMAPELLRPVGQAVDQRADLYSLGVVFYELLLGALPFHAADLLGWIHCHVAQAPRSPAEIDPELPAPLAAIVMRLLNKIPEERYQGARGLRVDLERCRDALARTGRIDPFPLAERDVPESFRLPQKLYGRAEEIGTLLAAVERVASAGDPELVLVSGYSGVGKSALVRELYRPIARHYGLFITGKFEQYKRDVPYATIVQAFGELVRQLLATSEERLAAWRQQLRDELGAAAQIIVDVIPQTELLLGRHPPPPPLPVSEAQNRFARVFRQFVGVFARAEHPLAIFLDDLQWADAASLRLLNLLITRPDMRHLLVICAYRDNEIDGAHPWTAAREDIAKSGVRISELQLEPLALPHVVALIADAFRCARPQAVELAQLVHAKTFGNPFFVGQLLAALHAEGLVRFDPDAGRWTWDRARIVARGYSESIVDLMLAKLRRLPAACQQALRLAACLGAEFSPETLALLTDRSQAAMIADLAPAVRDGLLLPRGAALQFLHDRVQQAAYSLTPEAERAAIHLRIGRLLHDRLADDAPAERLFEVVNHLNCAAALIVDPGERLALAELDLRAGVRAKQSTAHASARDLFAAGMALLPADAWQRHYDLQFALHRERCECECVCGDNDVAEALFDAALQHAATTLDRAQIQAIRVGLYYATGRLQQSIDVGVVALRALGVDIPDSPAARRELLGPEIGRLTQRFAGLDIDGLEHAPAVEDPVQRIASNLLVVLIPPTYYLDLDLFTLIILRLVDLSLTHGETDASVMGYASFALLLVIVLGEHELSGRLARMSLRRVDAIDDAFLKTKIYTIYGWFTGVWHEPFRRMPEYLQVGYQSGLEGGDLIYAAFALLGQDTCLLSRADDLAEVERVWTAHAPLFAEMQHSVASQTAAVVLDALPRLRGSGERTPGDPDTVLAVDLAGQMNSAVGTYFALRTQRAYILGDAAEAWAMGEQFEKVKVAGLLGTYYCTEGSFYRALAAAAVHGSADPERRPELVAVVKSCADSLATLAARNAEGFADRAALLGAELARIEGRAMEALRGYERAARIAHADGFRANEAIAHELAARLYAQLDLPDAAALHLRRAYQTYSSWGAGVKARALSAAHPELAPAPAPQVAATAPGPARRAAPSLDVMSVLKASQALSGEIVLDRLLASLMEVVIEHAGAERGVFLSDRGDGPAIAAAASVGAGGTAVEVSAAPRGPLADALAESVVRYVRRTRERVILSDPADGGIFAADPYVVRVKPRSVLCAPVMRKASLVGILYLENNWISGAFTPDRVSLLELIAAQAAISLENAALYADLARENAERRQAEQTVRESEERMRQLVETAGAVPWEADAATGRFIYVGPQAVGLLGYAVESWYARADFLPSITHPDDRPALAEHRAHPDPERRGLEFRVRDVGGRQVWLHSILGRAGADGRARGFLFDCSERKAAEEQLRDKLAIIEAQREAIRALSTPIIEVWHGVVTMPLFGAIDHARAAQMQERLLETVTRTRARAAILDLTGVGDIDPGTADNIIKLVHALRLLGAQGIVVGIRPDVAQAIVALGVDLSRIRTLSNLREALVMCMQGGLRARPCRT